VIMPPVKINQAEPIVPIVGNNSETPCGSGNDLDWS
jgi:hypothetical protein